jgi:heme/copper-type cytochrome/quinol oxidase subunit 2
MVTSKDVLHSFAIPNIGLKVDSNPGRLNTASISFNRLGSFYGHVVSYVVWVMVLCLLLLK